MNDPKILQMFVDVGAIVRDSHFVYSSGRHSSVYINKDALYLHTKVISTLCQLMAQPYNSDEVDVVVGPVLGGIVLSQWVALYAEKEGDGPDKKFLFRRGYDRYIPGKNVLVVEDVLTTGGSARQVIELVRMHGGSVVGLSALCNRGDVQPGDIDNVPISTLIAVTLKTFTEAECPFCQQKIPINTELGKGKAFLAKR